MVAPHVPWPASQGTAIRNLGIALELARRHAVTLIAFGAPRDPRGPLADAGIEVIAVPQPRARSLVRRLLDLVSTPAPDLARRLDSRSMRDTLARLARETSSPDRPGFDIVQIEGLEMASHGLFAHGALREAAGLSVRSGRSTPGRRLARPPRVVYDAHNAEWLLQARAARADVLRPGGWPGAAYSAAQALKLRRYEKALLGSVHAAAAVSAADAAVLARLAPDTRIAIAPNGVAAPGIADRAADRSAEDDDLCAFIGKMDFRPNIDAMTWFCAAVWPAIRSARPAARLEIVGRDPTPRVLALHAPERGVSVEGAVPDVAPYLARAAVIVVPLRIGGGTRLKVLEAMAAGCAIAATPLAVEGLNIHAGREAVLAAKPDQLAKAVVGLLGDRRHRRKLGDAARRRALLEYRWTDIVPEIERLYDA